MFLKIGVLKNFVIFTGNHVCWSLFLIKLQANLLRAASLFYRTPLIAASVSLIFTILTNQS